jgi:membrane associated rhomboid family serine protease
MGAAFAIRVPIEGPVMGIYDREYYRDGSSSFLGTLARRGMVWKWLIATNVVMLVCQLGTAQWGIHGWFTELFQLDTDKVVQHGQVWRLLTAAFLHSSAWQHIVFNMLILWWAGSEVEDIYGPREFLAFYLVAAVVSNAAYVGFQLLTGDRTPALGASGAVTAVLVAMHYQTRTVYLFFFFPVPVIILVVVYVALDALGALGFRPGENIGFAAHLGGAAFGYLYYRFHWRILNLLPTGWRWQFRRGERPKLRVYRGERESEPVPVAAEPKRPMPDSQLEAELDAVLAKVARHGKSSLTEREHQILMRASEIYRNRRK